MRIYITDLLFNGIRKEVLSKIFGYGKARREGLNISLNYVFQNPVGENIQRFHKCCIVIVVCICFLKELKCKEIYK